MGIMGAVRRLFGGGTGAGSGAEADEAAADGAGVEYGGYRIIPRPTRQGGQFLTSGLIVADGPAGRREHRFVRADTHASEDEAREFTIAKARRLIDEQGERLFQP